MKKKTVLLIEDEHDTAKMLQTVLEQENFSVEIAESAKEGYELAKMEPDVILLDLLLPDRSGFDVLTDLKKDPRTAHIPVIALTNLAEEAGLEKAIKRGAASYVVKAELPPREISELIRQVMAEPNSQETHES